MPKNILLPTFEEARIMCKERLLEACNNKELEGLGEDLLESPEFKRWFIEDKEVFKEHIKKRILPHLYLMQTPHGQRRVLSILTEIAALDEPVFAELLMELQKTEDLMQEFFDYLELFCALVM